MGSRLLAVWVGAAAGIGAIAFKDVGRSRGGRGADCGFSFRALDDLSGVFGRGVKTEAHCRRSGVDRRNAEGERVCNGYAVSGVAA